MLLNLTELISIKEKSLKKKIQNLKNKPKFSIIQVGNDPYSEKYVKNKVKKANELGINVEVINLPEDVNYKEVIRTIHRVEPPQSSGIMVQLPLPKHLQPYQSCIMDSILPGLDIDGLGVTQQGMLMSRNRHLHSQLENLEKYTKIPLLEPATAKVCIDIIRYYYYESSYYSCKGLGIYDFEGKRIAINSQSNLIGKPLCQMCLNLGMIPTMFNSKFPLTRSTENYDIIVTATGKPGILENHCLPLDSNGLLIDCTLGYKENCKKLYGDLGNLENYETTFNRIISGINKTGKLTVLYLLQNVVKVAQFYEG